MDSEAEILALIEQAFNTYSLNDGISLREAKGIDSHESKKNLNKAREFDEKNDWRNIPYKDIENIPSIFSLSNHNAGSWFNDHFQLIEEKHKNAIVLFLQWYESYDEGYYKKEIQQALEYWANA
ncbi:MAG: DUF6714 family protein [Candidatus Thiodiazotropha sp. DIVDIV]